MSAIADKIADEIDNPPKPKKGDGKDPPKGKKKKKGGGSQNPPLDIKAIFNDPQGFFMKGLESNFGQRRVPKEKQSDLDWIQEHGPVGNVKADGTKATRSEIVRANQNDLNRRNTPDLGVAQAAVREQENAQKMQAGQPGITKGDEAFRVAFGLPGTKEAGQPVGYATKPGGTLPVAPADERVNSSGNFTNLERGQIRHRIAEAPAALANLQPQIPQAPMTSQEQMNLLPGGKPNADLGAVFPQQPTGTNDSPNAAAGHARATGMMKNLEPSGGVDLNAIFSQPRTGVPPVQPAQPTAPAPTAPAPQVTSFVPPSPEEEQIRRFGKPYTRETFDSSPVGQFWQYLKRNLGQQYSGAQ